MRTGQLPHLLFMQTDRDSKEDINKVFRLFDVENRGYITIRELSKVSKELGEALTGEFARWVCCFASPLG